MPIGTSEAIIKLLISITNQKLDQAQYHSNPLTVAGGKEFWL